MPTTSPPLARRLLECLDELGVSYLVAHDPHVLYGDVPFSDVDLLLEISPWIVVDMLADSLGDMCPVIAWEYDTGSVTTFWSTLEGAEGVQLDLVCDPEGRGGYGFRTSRAFEYPTSGDWPPVMHVRGQAVYLASKRIDKAKRHSAQRAIQALVSIPGWEGDVQHLLDQSAQRQVMRAARGRFPTIMRRRVRVFLSRLGARGLSRLKHPSGVAVTLNRLDDSVAATLMSRFSRFVSHVTLSVNPSPCELWATRLRIFRPVLAISIQSDRPGVNRSPHTQLDDACRDVVFKASTITRRIIKERAAKLAGEGISAAAGSRDRVQ